jgi:hypothetical protein
MYSAERFKRGAERDEHGAVSRLSMKEQGVRNRQPRQHGAKHSDQIVDTAETKGRGERGGLEQTAEYR